MGVFASLKLLTSHVQFMGLLGDLSIPYPKEILSMLNFTNLFNFDPSFILRLIPDLPEIDQRILFIVVAIGLPLFLMVITALVFFTMSAVVMIATGGMGFVMLLAALLSKVASGIVPEEIAPAALTREFIITGGVMLAWPILSKVGRQAHNAKFLRILDFLLPVVAIMGGAVSCGFTGITRAVFIGACAAFAALRAYLSNAKRPLKVIFVILSLGAGGVVIWRYNTWSVPMPAQFYVPGMIVVVCGAFSGLQQVMFSGTSSVVAGTFARIRNRVKDLMDSALLGIALFALQCAFIPVVTNCANMFLCTTYSCAAGTKFNPFRERPEDSWTTDSSFFCDACDFDKDVCPYSVDELCPPFTSFRLLKHPAVPCDDKGFILFVIAGAIVLVVFVLVITRLFFVVIGDCTNRIVKLVRPPPPPGGVADDALSNPLLTTPSVGLTMDDDDDDLALKAKPDSPVPKKKPSGPPKPYDPDEAWEDAMESVPLKAASLYQDYKFTFRYFILIDLVYKILIVISNVVVAPYSNLSSVCNLAVHFVMTILLSAFRPFANKYDTAFAVVLGACDVINAGYTVALWRAPEKVGTPIVAIVIIAVNIVLPTVVGVLATVRSLPDFWQRYKARKKREKIRNNKRRLEWEDHRATEMTKFKQQLMSQPEIPSDVDDKARGFEKQLEKTFKEAYPISAEEEAARDLEGGTKSKVLFYFSYISAPLLIVALALTLFATTKADRRQFVEGSSLLDRSQDTVLNGYDSFGTFTENCCCVVPIAMPGYNVSERWMCRGEFLPLVRVSSTTTPPPRSTTPLLTTTRATTTTTRFGVTTTTTRLGITTRPGVTTTTTRTTTTTTTTSSTAPTTTTTTTPAPVYFNGTTRLIAGAFMAGRTINRGRVTTDLKHDGLPIRSACGRNITSTCNLTIKEGLVFLECPATWLKQRNISHQTELTLW